MFVKSMFIGIVALGVAMTVASAGLIVDITPANNQANMSTAAGQTFTTPSLGAENQLSTIAIMGPQTLGTLSSNVWTLKVWTDTDGDFSTWDPGTEVAASVNSLAVDTIGLLHTFNFSNEVLSDSTVYVVSFTTEDGLTDHAGYRSGLSNAGGVAITDGALFNAGVQPFGGAFDTSMQVTTIPEPSAIGLMLIGGLAMVMRRKRG